MCTLVNKAFAEPDKVTRSMCGLMAVPFMR